MAKFIHINVDDFTPRKEVAYEAGDVISIYYKNSLSGFGLHFAPVLDHQAWNIRSVNSSVGLDTYAPSQNFKLDGKSLTLVSAGNETIETTPFRNGHHLTIRAAGKGLLKVRNDRPKAYSPPHWAYDYWFSTPWPRMSEKEVLNEIDTAHSHRLSPKVWLLDAGWESNEEILSFNNKRFESGDNFVQKMVQKDLKPIVWLSPFVVEDTKIWHKCNDNGWLAKDEQGHSALFPVVGNGETIGSYLDFTNFEFLNYLGERISSMASLGLSGIMFDFGESLPDETVLACQTDESKDAKNKGLVGHNWFVGEIKRTLNELTKAYDFALISRSGWTNSHAHSGLWLGDQSSDSSRFAGLESLTWGYKTAHEAGYKFVGMDVGGYFGVPTPQDYKRWLDLSVCMPFSMLHGALQANPWEEGDDVSAYFRKTRELHSRIWHNYNDTEVEFESDQNNQRVTEISVNGYRFKTYSID